MKCMAGVDIGNSTTEVCVGQADEQGKITFLSSAMAMTTGVKGTEQNVNGIMAALSLACSRAGLTPQSLDLILINEAAPVMGDTAMETITETSVTGSAMIGHNPHTPAGMGTAAGKLADIDDACRLTERVDYILLVPDTYGYEEIARRVNAYDDKLSIVGLILQNDEAMLVENRLKKKIPIVDEVRKLDTIPRNVPAAIEVAPPGENVRALSNPYGIAGLLGLTPEETEQIIPMARSFIGKKSGVVIKTPSGRLSENIRPAGRLTFHGHEKSISVDIDESASGIMQKLAEAGELLDVSGQPHTNAGRMLNRIKTSLSELTPDSTSQVSVTDLLAVDTFVKVEILGAAAGECCLEKAVGVAVTVKTNTLPMEKIASRLMSELDVYVRIAGVEAVMACLGSLTTPGARLPVAILDLGGGSTDAAVLDENGTVTSAHLSGAGELVSMLIQSELGLREPFLAEQIKKCPAAKAESLYHIRLESGRVLFYDEPLAPKFYGRVVLLSKDGSLTVVEEDVSLEQVVCVRREAKRKVFMTNALRALEKITRNNIKAIPNVVLVGGSAEDFEIPEMLTEALAPYKIVCGRGNIRRVEGPRNAVATGLLMSY